MYFLSCTSIVWNRGYHFIFVCYCVKIDVEQRTGHFDNNLAGTENDLNQNSPKEFLILTLDIQSVHAKFNNLFPVIDNLASQGLYFGAICLQETWTSSDSDLSLLQLPGYQLIHQGSKCTKHGGLIIYLNENYNYEIRNLYTDSNIWEGLFIDINGGNLCRTFTIGNIYRPPHDNNNNNVNIQQFISELSPIIEILQSENTYAAIVGDFNINLSQISEREKFSDIFDLMCTSNFFPKISFPTRFARHSCSLIDQIFCKTPHRKHVTISSSIIFSNISDHLPCIANLCISENTKQQQKYVRTRMINDTAINNFRDELSEIDISSLLNANLATDPNTDYEKFEKIITKTYDKHFPEKCVKFNKYKHKRSNWITSGILKSIEFRDKLYKSLKMCYSENGEYELLKYNLKIYNGYLNRCIRTAKKKEFYYNEFNKYKNDIRKTWDTKKKKL